MGIPSHPGFSGNGLPPGTEPTDRPEEGNHREREEPEAAVVEFHKRFIRTLAEERIRSLGDWEPEVLGGKKTREILHELRVHQIELELQKDELYRIQTELEASRARFEDLYDFAPIGFLTVDEPGTIIECNLTATHILGFPRKELLGKRFFDFVLPLDQDIYYLHRRSISKSPGPRTCELRLLKPGKEAFWAQLHEGAFREGDDCIAGYRIALSDISAQKLAEEKQGKLQADLQQMQKLEAVGRLAGGIAHDFNNMLQVILGHTELGISMLDKTSPLFPSFREIRAAAERSVTLTRQLLTFARKQIALPKVLDLDETLKGMFGMLQRLLGERIKISWVSRSKGLLVKLDPTQLDQVLANLCINARDAMDNHGTITIDTSGVTLDETSNEVHPGVPPGDYVVLSVCDSGKGMDAATLSHIFEPFFTTKETGKGTGMGLATVFGIVGQNGGFISVKSSPGSGATFRTYLPRYSGEIESAPVHAPPIQTPSGCETILLVEDEPTVLGAAQEMLEKMGYHVLGAENADQALLLAKKHRDKIHLLVTDVMMPGMNGRELANRLQGAHPELECIFMSGYTPDAIAPGCLLNTGDHFLQKPFSFAQLKEKLSQVLDRKGGSGKT